MGTLSSVIFQMEKAELLIEREGKEEVIPVLFNPEQYNISRSVNYAKTSITGLDSPIIHFVSGQATTLNLTLYFDTQNFHIPLGTDEDVSKLTKPIMQTLCIDGKLHTPPKVTFSWGSFSFTGVVVSATQAFTMFLPSGKPVRAKIDLTFEYIDSLNLSKRKSPFESPDRTKVRVLDEDGALWRLSYFEYKDAGLWRHIARANNIYNPRKVLAGTFLKIPPLG